MSNYDLAFRESYAEEFDWADGKFVLKPIENFQHSQNEDEENISDNNIQLYSSPKARKSRKIMDYAGTNKKTKTFKRTVGKAVLDKVARKLVF